MGDGPLSPSYSSGRDFAVEVEGVRFLFGAEDFRARVGAAAARLGLVARDAQTPAVLDDLVALAAHGRMGRARSPLAGHVDRHAGELLDGPADLVQWLRRLVFRGAWVDQQVRDGTLVPEWDDRVGFVFRSAATGERAAEERGVPDLSALAWPPGDDEG